MLQELKPPRLGALILVCLLHIGVLSLMLSASRPASLPAGTMPMLEVGWLAAPGTTNSAPVQAAQPKFTPSATPREKSLSTPLRTPPIAKLLATNRSNDSDSAKPTEDASQASSSASTSGTASTSSGAVTAIGAGGGGSTGSVEAPGFDAAYLSNPAPSYPGLSRELGEQGRVLLRVLVSAEGKAQEIEIHKSSSHERLDKAASRAVWNWRFVPGRRDGQPTTARVIVPINFSLRK